MQNELKRGYFIECIIEYLHNYHPDLIEREYVNTLNTLCLSRYDTFSKSGFQSQEAKEQALKETLEGISSPYSYLKKFIFEQQESITLLRGDELPDDPDFLLTLLPSVKSLLTEPEKLLTFLSKVPVHFT